ncbi:hypothetical protein [Paenibacillus sp. sgz500958]|uniref:hypothetical protein n=1 Tax=Paenibacillus sp. sgz500958 TaxID=3242475 RepID=UPI0036D24DF3
MFQIEYEILDCEIKRISIVNDLYEFENDLNTIVGQIQLKFNGREEGFVDRDIPYEGEFLITWVQLLNEAIVYLKEYGFATIFKPDSDNIWFEFALHDNIVEVSKIRAEKQKLVPNMIEKVPHAQSEFFWSEFVTIEEFYETILTVSEKLLKHIGSINKLILDSRELIKLKEKLNDIKKIQF